MAYYATKRFSYWGQFGILTGLFGGGLIIGGVASFIPLLGKIDLFRLTDNAKAMMDEILQPENAGALRISQFLSTLFLFFLPPVFYALICHVRAWKHLGFTSADTQSTIMQAGLVIVIMLISLPAVALMQELTEMIPWSKATMASFKAAEETYNKQVAVIARMDSVGDYIISLLIIALLPAIFEETFFRGAVQNLLSRWIKMPVLSIVITAIIFSAVHGSYLGFLSRFALGFVLGWFYYRTGNIWLNILAHFFNNALAVTSLYLSTRTGEKVDPSKMEEHFPLWAGLLSIAAVVLLFILFGRVSKKTTDRPGKEVLMPEYNLSDNPFYSDTAGSNNN